MADAAPKKASNLALRLLTAGIGIPIILALLFVVPKPGFFVLVLAAIGVGAAEALAMTLPGERDRQVLGVLLALGLSTLLYFSTDARALAAALVGLVIVSLTAFLVRVEPVETAAKRFAFFLFSVLYASLLLTPIGLLHQRPDGPRWVILAMVIAWLGDTGAYFAGRALGKHKLMPVVSPKKTLEGALGGIVTTTGAAAAYAALFLPSLPILHALVLGLVGGALGIVGDLCESLLKRSVGVKDSGWILPGHGGLLDRVDALMFTGAGVWVYTVWLARP